MEQEQLELIEHPAASGKRFNTSNENTDAKRRRRSGGPEAAFEVLICDGGCEMVSSRDKGHEFEVTDARLLRRLLEQKLTLNPDLKINFLGGLEDMLQEPGVLYAALKPMLVTGPNAPVTGDSFIRVLLNVAPVQKDIAKLLLEKLPEFVDGEGEEETILPRLILGQFRWLDHIVDSHWLTEKVLEVLPVCPQELQMEAIAFLPEIAQEDDYEAVLRVVEELMETDSAFIVPVIEAVSSLSLGPEMQGQVVDMMLGRFQSADPRDLPALVRFLLQHATTFTAKTVVASLREGLHFVNLADPRLAVPDRKQKGKVLRAGDNPEYQILDAIKQGVQLSSLAADAFIKEIRSLTEPQQHKPLDLWVLLLFYSLGADRRKVAEVMLRKKLGEGHADAGWIRKSIAGHERAMVDCFPTLLSVAQQLTRAVNEVVSSAGAALFVTLFTHFTGAYHQQEILRALHAHLGAHLHSESSAALRVLRQLSKDDTAGLMKYAAFLTNILDYLDGYTDDQTEQVFEIFSELVAGTCKQNDESGQGGERSRMEDELFIFLRKQLSGAQASHRRVGIIGVVALVQRLGMGLSDGTEGAGAIGARYTEAMAMLRSSFDECQRSPDSFAFLCDQLAHSIQQQRVSKKLMRDLSDHLSEMFESRFVTDPITDDDTAARASVQVGSAQLAGHSWWNLDGEESPAALKMLPFLAEQAMAPAGTGSRNPLIYLFSTIRLLATIDAALNNNRLEGIDALLGCSVLLFPMELASPATFGSQPPEVQRVVLLGVFYVLNWYRELVNAFAVQLDLSGERGPGSDKLDLKLFARLRGIVQLECVLDTLLSQAPPLFSLPVLSNTLDTTVAPTPKQQPAVKPKVERAKKLGGRGGAATKGVQFDEQGEGSQGGEPKPGSSHSKSSASDGTQGGEAGVAAGATGRGAATQGAAAAATVGFSRLSADRSKFRSLLLPALGAMGVTRDQTCYAMLAPAGFLLADLHSKLKAVLFKTKRPAFLRGPAKPALPLDVSHLTPLELLEAVQRVLPAVRQQLDTSMTVILEQLSEEFMLQEDQQNVWSGLAAMAPTQSTAQPVDAAAFLVSMPSNSAAQEALSPSTAANRVATLSLDCIRLMLTYPGIGAPAHRPTLQALLYTFGGQAPEQPAAAGEVWDGAQLLRGCKRAFVYFVEKTPTAESQGQGEVPAAFEHCHSLLLIADALVKLRRSIQAGLSGDAAKKALKLTGRMSERLGAAAQAMLAMDWRDPAAQEVNGWKGRNPVLGDALHLYITHVDGGGSADRLKLLKRLGGEVFPQVTEVTTGKKNSEPSQEFPSLSGATLAVWYRVALEELQVVWDTAVGHAAEMEKLRAFLDDADTVGQMLGTLGACAEVFGLLMGLVKYQDRRAAIHVQAIKSGGKFIETFFKAISFWAKLFDREDYASSCIKMVKDMQKGTKIIQVLCSEGKTRKELPLTAKVPQVKRTVERFLFKVNEALLGAGKSGIFWLGNLKHKNLHGEEVPSQMYPEDEGASEEEGGMSDAETEDLGRHEEDEGEGETQGYDEDAPDEA